MSRIDKYDPVSGGFRAKLNAAVLAADAGKIQAVSLNSSGRVVIGGTNLNDLVGVICPVGAMSAADVVDVMQAGEMANATETAGTAFTAGAKVYAHADGTVNDTATAGIKIGTTVELDRLVVRFSHGSSMALADLADVTETAPTNGQVLKFDTSLTPDAWAPAADA